jgi:hypothetical protein
MVDQAAITDEAIYAVWTDPGMTRWAAAMRLGITPTALSRRARRLGLPMRERVDQRSEMTCVSDARIREVWSRENLTRKEQAHEVGLALSALSSRARRLGLPIRRSVPDHRIPAARIREVWLDPVLTVRQGAAMLGLAPASLRRRAEALGLPLRGRRGRPVVASKANEALFREMWMARVRAADMAVHFRVHPMTVSGHARRLGLARRAPSPRPIPLDRFWSRRREAELGVALSERAKAENAAMRRQRMEDHAGDLAPLRPVARRLVLRDELQARGISLAQIACDLGLTYGTVDMVISGRHRSRRIEQALDEMLGSPIL